MGDIRATMPDSGKLRCIDNCYISATINGTTTKVNMYVLPDIGDGKAASYSDENTMGRSAPLKAFNHSENRNISWDITFITYDEASLLQNLRDMFFLESLVLPMTPSGGVATSPPPVAQLVCGRLLHPEGKPICAVMKSYSVKFPTSDAVWSTEGPTCPNSYLPSKFTFNTQWEEINACGDLPTQSSRLFNLGGTNSCLR